MSFSIVSDDERGDFLQNKLGNACVVFESAAYSFGGKLCEDYNGAYWQFCEIDGGGFFMYPKTSKSFQCAWENGSSEELSAEGFGVVACLFALSHISIRWHKSSWGVHIADAYHSLVEYARTREDWQQIAALID